MSTILFANNASTTLAGSITNTALTANLQAGSGVEFPNPVGGQHFVGTFVDAATGLLNEIVWVTAISGDTITMIRGEEGTTPLNWSAGDFFSNLWTAGQAQTLLNSSNIPTLSVTGSATTYNSSQINSNIARSNGGALMQDLLPGTGPGVLAAGDTIYITNADTVALLCISAGSGATMRGTKPFILLGPGQTASFLSDGTGYWPNAPYLAVLAQDLELFVSTTGLNSNNGLTSGSPFLDTQTAYNFCLENIHMNGWTIYAQHANGTYSTLFVAAQQIAGQAPVATANPTGCFIVRGNTSSMDSVIFSVVSNWQFQVGFGVVMGFEWSKFVGSGSIPAAIAAFGTAVVNNVDFGAFPGGYQMFALSGSFSCQNGNITISGGAEFFIFSTDRSEYFLEGATITLTGTPAFTTFVQCGGLTFLGLASITFIGSATGQRYLLSQNTVASTGGAGATYLPGSSAGAVQSGGQYT